MVREAEGEGARRRDTGRLSHKRVPLISRLLSRHLAKGPGHERECLSTLMESMDDGILGRAFAARRRGGRTRGALTPFYYAGICFLHEREG